MNASQLLTKLTEIERAIGVVDSITLRKMVVEAQEFVLQTQKENVEHLRRKSREQMPPGESESSAFSPPAAEEKIRKLS
jgi:hypothetical protein